MTLDLIAILQQAGVANLSDHPTQIKGSCPNPAHRDAKPSWYISKSNYAHFCHACGYKGTISQLLTDLTGSAPPDLEQNLAQESFLGRMRRITEDPVETLAPIVPLLTDWALVNILLDVPQRLLDLRRLRREAVDYFGVRWDRLRRSWVLPLRTEQGVLLGAQYRQKGVVHTDEHVAKASILFGLSQQTDERYTVLVESPLDAVRLRGLGIPAVSSLGAWVSNEQCKLLARHYERVYVALDDDKAGHEAAERVTPVLRRMGTAPIPWSYTGTGAKDIGDIEEDRDVMLCWDRTRRFGMPN